MSWAVITAGLLVIWWAATNAIILYLLKDTSDLYNQIEALCGTITIINNRLRVAELSIDALAAGLNELEEGDNDA